VSEFGKVAVLMGGRSAEREISLMSGKNVLEGLQRKGVDAHAFDPAERELFELKRDGYQRAFLILHGRYGEDGTVQGALETMGIPYTGSGVMASALCMDKLRTKLVWLALGIPTPRYAVLTADSDWTSVAKDLGLPLIVKPAHEGSSIGLTKVATLEKIQPAYELAAKCDTLVIAEEFIGGRELTGRCR
jgi:D-alanine-D-alanine ligase